MASNLGKRALTGFPLAGVLAALVFWAPAELLLVLMAGILMLAAAEWARLAGAPTWLGPLALVPCLLAIAAWITWVPAGDFAFFVVMFGFWLYTIVEILRIERRGELGEILPLSCTFTAGVFVLGGMFGAFFALLGTSPQQLGWQLPEEAVLGIGFDRLLLAGVLTMGVFADIGGYFAGRFWGRTQLSPTVSSSKTWQGFLGALAFGLVLPALLFPLLPLAQWGAALSVAIALICLGVFGDLWESLRKRYSDAKDSGNLIAGHGGVLDRLDSHLLILPSLALVVSFRNLL